LNPCSTESPALVLAFGCANTCDPGHPGNQLLSCVCFGAFCGDNALRLQASRESRSVPLRFCYGCTVLLCYAQFPFWPSDPPRAIFRNDDLPSYQTIFRRFNLWILGNFGIHTSVFPSAHVAAAFGAALGVRVALPERR
jgi:Pyruvate/2-oxoacid:ferredoxin oxidoreductase delta subunit